MEQFISVDWGTSFLRCRVIDTAALAVKAEAYSEAGIANTFESWSNSGKNEEERLSFYQSLLTEEIKKLEKKTKEKLEGLPVSAVGAA